MFADGRVYGGGYFSGGLVAWNPATAEWSVYDFYHQIEGIATHKGIRYLGVHPNAEIYAFDGQGHLFGITAGMGFELDPATRQVLRTKEYVAGNWGPVIGFQPRAVTYDPNDGHLYGRVSSPPRATAPARRTSCRPTTT